MEVVLGFAQVQGEGVVQEAEAGQGLLQSVDGAGGNLEVAVEVVVMVPSDPLTNLAAWTSDACTT
ncbi:hypothetical protein GCM10010279_34540 [Streptomyces mutabilis]|nr:hypothetical protein GCM10010279_34540 [Streptomyces mutabilis]